MSIKANLKVFLDQINLSGRQLSVELGKSISWWGTATDSTVEGVLDKIKNIYPMMNMDFVLSGDGAPMILANDDFMNWSWKEYYEKLINSSRVNRVSLAGRVALLDEANYAFNQNSMFSEIDCSVRENLAGIIKRASASTGYNPEIDWYLFGCIKNISEYIDAIRTKRGEELATSTGENRKELRDSIDLIPLSGEINETQFECYSKSYSKIWHEDPIATASRLLAIKRPDYFVSINSSNIDGLKDLLHVNSIVWKSYWDCIKTIHKANWYKEAESVIPRGPFEAKCIKYRVALLDCITVRQHS